MERGRTLFNGKGLCFYCHGLDGDIDRPPELTPLTAQIIARLDPKPFNLRDPDSLQSKDDRDRFRAIREGHSGTGPLPDSALTDEDILDLLAYLAALRGDRPEPGRGPQR